MAVKAKKMDYYIIKPSEYAEEDAPAFIVLAYADSEKQALDLAIGEVSSLIDNGESNELSREQAGRIIRMLVTDDGVDMTTPDIRSPGPWAEVVVGGVPESDDDEDG